MDLSKEFDTLNHDVLLAKLNAYGFKDSLTLIRSYLKNRGPRSTQLSVLGRNSYLECHKVQC